MEKIKPLIPLMIVLLLCGIFFYLGRISMQIGKENEAILVTYPVINTSENTTENTLQTASANFANTNYKPTSTPKSDLGGTNLGGNKVATDGNVIGAKTSKKYYFPWCGTVKRIKAENQVFFKTISDAKSAGYIPGGNCKGLW